MLNVRNKRLAATAAIAGSFFLWGAAANATTITALEHGGSTTALLGSPIGIFYGSNDGLVSGAGSLHATYEFHYTPPPINTAVFATTNNDVPALISNFLFSWYYSASDLGTGGDGGTFIMSSGAAGSQPLPLGAAGFYFGVITGNIASSGGNYSLDLNVFTSRDQGNTPLPAALPLFASVLGGGGLLARWRRKRSSKIAAA